MSEQMVQTLGSALIHFLWEGVALSLLLYVAVSFTRDARIRYGLAVSVLVLMALCPMTTVWLMQASVTVTNTLDYAPVSTVVSNVSTAVPAAAAVRPVDWLAALVWAWCGGVFIFGVRAFGGWVMLKRLRRTAQETIGAPLLERCRILERRIGIGNLVRYAHSEMVDAPAVVGWIRPVVLIPLSALAGLSAEQLEAILAHELAHIKRYDALVNLFQIVTETVLFYHPAVWWVNRVIRAEREHCCDDIAVAVCGDAAQYARALAVMGGSQTRPMWAMAANGGALKARIGRLLGMNKMVHGVPRAGLAVLALLCVSCVLLAAGGFKQDLPVVPPPPPPPPAAPAQPDPPTPNVEELMRQTKALKYQMDAAPNRKMLRELERQVRDVDQKTMEHQAEQLARLAQEMAFRFDSADRDEQAPAEEQKGGSYIDSLESAGLKNLTVDELIELKVQGVTADYVRQIKAAGFDASVHELLGLKVQGVTPEYIRDIRATGLKPSAHELMSLKVQGVTPEYIRALQSAGFPNLQLHDFIAAKVQGITPDFIEKVRGHGFKELTFRQLISLKVAGVF
jgi:beta-lactamase regulating signal transducer with metallopeptidase domain